MLGEERETADEMSGASSSGQIRHLSIALGSGKRDMVVDDT
jgi:hypothetical protein